MVYFIIVLNFNLSAFEKPINQTENRKDEILIDRTIIKRANSSFIINTGNADKNNVNMKAKKHRIMTLVKKWESDKLQIFFEKYRIIPAPNIE